MGFSSFRALPLPYLPAQIIIQVKRLLHGRRGWLVFQAALFVFVHPRIRQASCTMLLSTYRKQNTAYLLPGCKITTSVPVNDSIVKIDLHNSSLLLMHGTVSLLPEDASHGHTRKPFHTLWQLVFCEASPDSLCYALVPKRPTSTNSYSPLRRPPPQTKRAVAPRRNRSSRHSFLLTVPCYNPQRP